MAKIQPFFLDRGEGKGQRFCILHPAQGEERGRVLHIHPFAEEMNKSRRMAALQARAMAAAGFSVLQIDLLGCGDSSGEFADATWQDWLEDLEAGVATLNERAAGPLWLWGHRAGCLLACELAERLSEPCSFVFWHPPSSGKILLQQFLRMKLACDMLSGKAVGAMDKIKNDLLAGNSVEVAGYTLSAELAAGLESSILRPPSRPSQASWLELSAQENPPASPALSTAAQRWQAANSKVRITQVQGPSFWQTSEIEDAPNLLSATLNAVQHMQLNEVTA